MTLNRKLQPNSFWRDLNKPLDSRIIREAEESEHYLPIKDGKMILNNGIEIGLEGAYQQFIKGYIAAGGDPKVFECTNKYSNKR